jgi:DNA-binding NarL/FixJ family response regulator
MDPERRGTPAPTPGGRAGRIGVLVVDDHPVVREGVIALLSRQPDMVVVGEAGSGREALARFHELGPDLAVLDLRLPDLDGVEVTASLCAERPGSRVLVLTSYDGDEEIHQALSAGARGYLLKNALREELVAAVRAVHAGRRYIPAPVARRLAERLPASELTRREMDVLRLIVEGKANKEIANALGLTEGTVKGYVNTMLAKIGAADRTQAAITALRRGLLRLSDPIEG